MFDIPSAKWEQLSTQLIPLICIMQVSNTLLHFMGNSASNNKVDGKGKMFQKITSAQMHTVQHADRNVIH